MTETEKANTVQNGNSSTNIQTSRSLHVSGLPLETTEEDILFFFKDYGISSAKIFNKNSKVYAHAVFDNSGEAERARNDLNGLNLIPRYSQSGISKPISIAVLEANTIKESIKKDLDKNLLVKNIAKSVSGRDFYLLMRAFGDIKLCKLVVDYYGVSKGYGYVYFYEAKSAEEALNKLNSSEIKDKTLTVCHLIPGKTRENYKNNIYVKNLPKNYTEEDLKKLFEKFGEIKSAVVSRDASGESKGFGFVCFNNPGNANQALRELKSEKLILPGCYDPLYLNYAQKKDERVEQLMKDSFKLEQLSVFARLREDMYLVKTVEDFEKEIKNFLKLLMGQEYTPRDIKIKMDTKTAIVTMNSQKDLENLMNKYVDYCTYYLPRIFLNYYQNKNERSQTQNFINEINTLVNPVNMFSNFQNLSIVDPNKKPIIYLDKDSNNKNASQGGENRDFKSNYIKRGRGGKYDKLGHYNYKNNYYDNYHNNYYYNSYRQQNNHYYSQQNYSKYIPRTHTVLVDLDQADNKSVISKQSAVTPIYELETKDEVASSIYDIVVNKYPENAGKITGMIFDLGLREMKRLLEKRDQLDKIVQEANEMLTKENAN